MNNWLLKTEPSEYSFDDLLREKNTRWQGVRNHQALSHLRAMTKGDQALIYHTGDEKQIVGLAAVTSNAYADPDEDDERLVVVDVKALRRVATPVTLAQIKSDPAFKAFDLVRLPRLSVMPVSQPHWETLSRLCGL